MTSPLTLHPPQALIKAFCDCIANDIHPLSEKAVAEGSNLYGAAILRKSDLSIARADTNQAGKKVGGSPLWHGETWCIKQFFEIPRDDRPDVKDCLFLTTHEPCSLCLSAITWAGFDNFTYMFTYEDTQKLFNGSDLDVFEHVFHQKEGEKAQQASKDGTQKQVRPEYKLRNKYFVALSFAELVAAVEDPAERDRWDDKVKDTKRNYGMISKEYRKNTRA